MNGKSDSARVVIIGGGFGGLFAARALRRAPVSMTLIDRDGTHLFQPLLYQCATGILSEGHITAALRHLFRKQHNLDCLTAEAVDVDADGRRVICQLPLGEHFEVPYDHLIVAAGMRQSYFGHDEFATWAPGMKDIADALTIRRRVYGAFDMAETASDPADQRRWLTFALVGAGPTGVELAGQIRELATKTLRDEYRKFQPKDARVMLFDGGSAPLATFGDELSRKATSALQSRGVELHMGSIVTHVDGDGLVARDHDGHETSFDARTVLWTAGVEAPPIAEALAKATGAEHDRAGRIAVQDDLTIQGHPEISVIGDMMSLRRLPGVAEVAMQAGLYTGHRIERLQKGNDSQKPFKYRDLGTAAYLYRGNAVVSAGRLKLSGFPAWVVWLFIHIAFLTGYRNRLGAILTWWVAFTRDIRRERTYTTRETGRLQDIYQRVGPQESGTAAGDADAPTPRPPSQRSAPPTPATHRRAT
jgi:NADH:ubiquinone reductase (H+-translocating)